MRINYHHTWNDENPEYTVRRHLTRLWHVITESEGACNKVRYYDNIFYYALRYLEKYIG